MVIHCPYNLKLHRIKNKYKLHLRLLFGRMLHYKKVNNNKFKIRLKYKKFIIKYRLFKTRKIWSPNKKFNYHLFLNITPKCLYKSSSLINKKCHHNQPSYKNIFFIVNLHFISRYNYEIRKKTPPLSKIPKIFIDNHFINSYIPINKIKFFSIKKTVIWRQFRQYNLAYIKNKLLRKRLRRWTNRYRKIKKYVVYNKIILQLFAILTGLNLFNIKQLWLKIRRNSLNSWGTNYLINTFTIQITLLPHNLLFLLGFISSTMSGLLLLKQGAVIRNGQISTSTSPFKPGDIIQLQSWILHLDKRLYSQHTLNTAYNKVSYLPFLYVDFSILLITIIRYPFSYELLPRSFLSTRWVRYYIRNFSVKNKHY